ncbi:MAG: hypothetical protein KAI57_04590 [Candidatus Pacebacteria bacterium]|nr:hypothetical protein [Candidatus Paceibacterota bacterium]
MIGINEEPRSKLPRYQEEEIPFDNSNQCKHRGILSINTILFIPSAIIFFLENKRTANKKIKLKSYLLFSGILLFFLGGPIHNFVTTPTLTLIVDLLIVIGALIMTLSIFISEILDKNSVKKEIRIE